MVKKSQSFQREVVPPSELTCHPPAPELQLRGEFVWDFPLFSSFFFFIPPFKIHPPVPKTGKSQMSRPFQPWQRPLLWVLVWMISVKGLVQRRLHGLRSSQKKMREKGKPDGTSRPGCAGGDPVAQPGLACPSLSPAGRRHSDANRVIN